MVAFAHGTAHTARPATWWAVDPDGTIRETLVVGDVGDATRAEFAQLWGADLATLTAGGRDATDTPTRCGVEVLTVLAANDMSAPAPPAE